MSKRTVLYVSVGIGAALSFLYLWQKRQKFLNNQEPTAAAKWHKIGEVQEIDLYPVKSGAALEITECAVDALGLNCHTIRDRQLVLIREDNNKMAYAGTFPLLLSIKTNILADQLITLEAPNAAKLCINIREMLEHGDVIEKRMKGFVLKLIEGTAEQHQWFSQVVLSKPNGLKFYIKKDIILNKSKWWQKNEACDFMPLMILHDKSIAYLNGKLTEQHVTHHRQFRGNLLIKSVAGVEPFDEDNWNWLKIGDDHSVLLKYNSPCMRCILPNINIFNYERNKDFEPLKTLKTFRLRSHPKEPEMGVYFDVYKTGSGLIRQGAAIYVSYKN